MKNLYYLSSILCLPIGKRSNKWLAYMLFFLLIGASTNNIYAQSIGDYQTDGAVNFVSATNWLRYNGATFVAAPSAPEVNDGVITILSGHTATVTAAITLDQLTVASGGMLVVNTGVILTVADGTGTDLTVNGTLDIKASAGIAESTGTETFVFATGSTIRTSEEFGITSAVFATNITWANGMNFVFEGAIPQTASLPIGFTVNNLEINNNAGNISFDGVNLTITGTLTLTAGVMDLTGTGASITFSGATPISVGTGSISTGGGTNITFAGTTDYTIPNIFGAGALNTLTIDHTGTVACSQNFSIGSALNLTQGIFDISGRTIAFTGGNTPITRTTGTLTTSATTNITFSGTGNAFAIPNGTFTNSPFAIGTLTVNRTNNLSLGNQSATVTTSVAITGAGKLDLNGNNIVLASTGTLSENLATNSVIYDATATSYTVRGGYIEVTNFPTFSDAGFSAISGIGLAIQGTGTNVTAVRRYHYPPATGGGANITKGIKRIYSINGTAVAGVTDIRLSYASSELNGISDAVTGNMYMSRWRSTDGWKSFQHGTNGVTFSAGTITMLNIDGFSDWTMSGAPTPLPISLLWLKGEREKDEDVKLTWATASEINNKGFEIQISDNAQTFKTISFVEGRGNSTTVNSYQLAVNNASDSYYRLKQIDFDGKFSYSPVVFVEGVVGKVVVYPNPSNGTFSISVGKDKLDLPARLLNAQGIESPLIPEGGIYKVSANLPAGIYFLHTTVAGKTNITKVVIER